MANGRTIPTLLGLIGGAALLSACEPVVLSVKPASSPFDATPVRSGVESEAPTIEPVVEHPDGSVTLNSILPEHLLGHLRTCLVAGRYELLYEQLISDAAKQAYVDAGRDPHELMAWFQRHQRDVLLLLQQMPFGMDSPNVIWQPMNQGVRIQVRREYATDLRFRTIDIIREHGQFRVLLVS